MRSKGRGVGENAPSFSRLPISFFLTDPPNLSFPRSSQCSGQGPRAGAGEGKVMASNRRGGGEEERGVWGRPEKSDLL